nr:16S rRNA (cytosine(967)-C(5))-methyltransferase RsmB [Eubacteriales bacterium]
MKNARLSAFDMLYDIIYGGAYSNIVLEKGLKSVESKDKGFVSRLVYGVIERRLSLDYAINKFLNGKTKPKVKILLYIGAYQVLYMDKIPDAVAVYETVSLCDNIGLSYYKKLINAVLHRIIDYKTEFDSIDDLSIKYSCPQHLINMWTKMYGEDNVVDILESINNRPPVFAIPNSKYVDAEELYYELFSAGIDCEILNDVVKINSSFDLSQLKAFNDGLFYIEDYSSYSCAKALGAKSDDVVLDLCSAPGGKAFTIAQSGATVYAYDIYEHRVELIKKSAQKLGLNNIITGINDALIYNANIPFADRIICDVPCSGFGIIRRKPEIRYKNLDDIKELPQIQYNILFTSSRYLKSGGVIIYSTCTLNKKENEQVVDRFLNDNTDFSLVESKTVFPTKNGGDGFFYSILKKKND